VGRIIAGGYVTAMANRILHRPYLGDYAVNRTFIFATSCRVKSDSCKTGVTGHVHCMSSANNGSNTAASTTHVLPAFVVSEPISW
jgi:hypothetical protein